MQETKARINPRLIDALFDWKHGIIPVYNIEDLAALQRAVKETHRLSFVQAYKLRIHKSLRGLSSAVKVIRHYTRLPVICDLSHDKYNGSNLRYLGRLPVDAVTIPYSSYEELEDFLRMCNRSGLTSILKDSREEPWESCEIFPEAYKMGINHFLLSEAGSREIRRCISGFRSLQGKPRFIVRFSGKDLCGAALQAFSMVGLYPCYVALGDGEGRVVSLGEMNRVWNTLRAFSPTKCGYDRRRTDKM